MQVYIDERTQLIDPDIGAPRRSWRRRRIRCHLRRVGRGVASRVAGSWIGLIKALHESRRRSAARLIDQHRHLIARGCCAHDASLETHSSDPVQS